MMVINSYGLKLGNVTYKPGAYEGTVLFQMVNNTNIGDDVYIEKGTTIDLVVSSGTSNEEVEVPMLVGLTLKEARTLILESGLELGSVVYSTQNGYKEGIVFKQKPESTSQGQAIKVKMGTEIDIWVSGSEPSSP
jgi:beta-lactam-binding protein with PASTA domain